MNKRSAANGRRLPTRLRANEDLGTHGSTSLVGPGFWGSELHFILEKRDETTIESTSTHVVAVACDCSRRVGSAAVMLGRSGRACRAWRVSERSASNFRVLNLQRDWIVCVCKGSHDNFLVRTSSFVFYVCMEACATTSDA